MAITKTCSNPACGKDYTHWAGSPNHTCPYCYNPYGHMPYVPTTQKAKGICALVTHYKRGQGSALTVSAVFPVKDPFVVPVHLQPEIAAGRLFARPCPPNPEHGFVESKVVHSEEELEELRLATFAANPDSEIILVPLIAAKWNAVWTPSLLAVGPDHDGATGGKGATAVPLVGMSSLTDELVYTHAGVKPGAAPYIEAVGETNGPNSGYYGALPTLTQLRGGPVLASGVSPDFIPVETTVDTIIKTNGEDLLEWAKIIRAIKGFPGTVVWHPGGVLTDHYSVHCRENGVPLITTFEPVVGLVLEPPPEDTSAIPLDPVAMLTGLAAGDLADVCTDRIYGPHIALALVALHNSAALRGSHAFWLGVAASNVLKLGHAALRGEARHAHNLPKGMKGKPECYTWYGKRSLTFCRAGLSRVTQLLHYGFGDPATFKGGFGGPKWSLCGAALCPLFNSVRDLAANPTAETASEVVTALNIAINQAHNGGWWFNKFINVAAYDAIPKGVPEFIIYASEAILAIEGLRAKAGAYLPQFQSKAAAWPLTSIAPLKWRRATLDVSPGLFTLELKPATVPMASKITIPATTEMVASLTKSVGSIAIEPGRVRLIQEGSEEIPIWTETPITARIRDPKDRSTW